MRSVGQGKCRCDEVPMSYRIFVSYSTLDLGVVQKIERIVTGTGIEVFVAEHSVKPGERLDSRLLSAIRDCDLFLVLVSSHSVQSSWVEQEIGIATASNKPILPVLLEPEVELPGVISGVKYLRAHDNPEEALVWLRQTVFAKAQKKQQNEALVWLGLGALVVYLAAGSK